MQRRTVRQRDDWKEKFDALGFSFHSLDGAYWLEGVCYEFTAEQIDHLEAVTADLHDLCLAAVERVITEDLFSRLGIPVAWGDFIRRSWQRRDISLYGRFDFAYDGSCEPKLLEYNADTPTSLVESSIAQWVWLEDVFPELDQFNSIHEKLLDGFAGIAREQPPEEPFFFTCVKGNEEDLVTVDYLRDVAGQSGLDGRHVFIEDLGFDSQRTVFCDLDGTPVRQGFKLYPWEWLLAEEFGAQLQLGSLHFFEPAWKLVLSSKGILPLLWEMAPGHPNLLPSFTSASPLGTGHARKPLFSREGANIVLVGDGHSHQGPDAGYGNEGHIYQQLAPLPCFDGKYPMVGSWVVNGLPAGIGIREDASPITSNTSMFVPHFFHP